MLKLPRQGRRTYRPHQCEVGSHRRPWWRVEVQEKKRWRRELKEDPSFHDFGKPAVEHFVGYHFVQISPVDKPHLARVAHHVISAEECSGGHTGDADLLRALHDAWWLIHLKTGSGYLAWSVWSNKNLEARINILLECRGVPSITLVVLSHVQTLGVK